jgi:NAD(P)-dependent dehydrogenase (short-subunit alcohol dehydrogenase family)
MIALKERFAGKGAVVTGAASGIGLAITQRRRHFNNPEVLAASGQRIPMGRPAQPEKIAAPALVLASGDASYVNGASLLVDGARAVSGYPDMRPFRGPCLWNGSPQA